MVVRRIREHVAAYNWFAVGVDLAIVVAGVFLGIQASNWNDARIEAEQGVSYRQRLIEELDFNIRQHRQQSAYYRQVLGHGLEAMGTLQTGRANDPTQFLVDALQLTQVDTSPGKSYIYNEMVSSGLVARIGDETVQQAASDYYIQLAATDRALLEIQPYRDIVRGLVPYVIQAAIQENCGDRYVYHRQQIVGVQLAAECSPRLDPSLASTTADRLLGEPEIDRHIVRYLGLIHERLASLDNSLLLAGRLKKSLIERAGDGGKSAALP